MVGVLSRRLIIWRVSRMMLHQLLHGLLALLGSKPPGRADLEMFGQILNRAELTGTSTSDGRSTVRERLIKRFITCIATMLLFGLCFV